MLMVFNLHQWINNTTHVCWNTCCKHGETPEGGRDSSDVKCTQSHPFKIGILVFQALHPLLGPGHEDACPVLQGTNETNLLLNVIRQRLKCCVLVAHQILLESWVQEQQADLICTQWSGQEHLEHCQFSKYHSLIKFLPGALSHRKNKFTDQIWIKLFIFFMVKVLNTYFGGWCLECFALER